MHALTEKDRQSDTTYTITIFLDTTDDAWSTVKYFGSSDESMQENPTSTRDFPPLQLPTPPTTENGDR